MATLSGICSGIYGYLCLAYSSLGYAWLGAWLCFFYISATMATLGLATLGAIYLRLGYMSFFSLPLPQATLHYAIQCYLYATLSLSIGYPLAWLSISYASRSFRCTTLTGLEYLLLASLGYALAYLLAIPAPATG